MIALSARPARGRTVMKIVYVGQCPLGVFQTVTFIPAVPEAAKPFERHRLFRWPGQV